MIKRYKYIGLVAILMFTGCTPKVKLPAPVRDKNISKSVTFSDRPVFNRNVDEKYHLKPEPYSLSSHQKDPELLGPQSTIKNNPLKNSDKEVEETNLNNNPSSPQSRAEVVSEVYDNNQKVASNSTTIMSKSQCISMIGESTFNSYVQKYGSESAALRRCALLSRLN